MELCAALKPWPQDGSVEEEECDDEVKNNDGIDDHFAVKTHRRKGLLYGAFLKDDTTQIDLRASVEDSQ